MRVRPILSSLLADKTITEDEKDKVLRYLGGAESLNEENVEAASELAENSTEVLGALKDIFQRHTTKPEEEIPAQPTAEPQKPAGTSETVKDIIAGMIG